MACLRTKTRKWNDMEECVKRKGTLTTVGRTMFSADWWVFLIQIASAYIVFLESLLDITFTSRKSCLWATVACVTEFVNYYTQPFSRHAACRLCTYYVTCKLLRLLKRNGRNARRRRIPCQETWYATVSGSWIPSQWCCYDRWFV